MIESYRMGFDFRFNLELMYEFRLLIRSSHVGFPLRFKVTVKVCFFNLRFILSLSRVFHFVL